MCQPHNPYKPIQLFRKYLLRPSHLQGTVTGAGFTRENKIEADPAVSATEGKHLPNKHTHACEMATVVGEIKWNRAVAKFKVCYWSPERIPRGGSDWATTQRGIGSNGAEECMKRERFTGGKSAFSHSLWLNTGGGTKGLGEASRYKRRGWGRALNDVGLQVQEGLVKDFVLWMESSGCSAQGIGEWLKQLLNTSQEATAVA